MNKNFEKILKKIIGKRLPCYFISPHLDDAALSAGGLISYLVEKEVPVTIVNVFTKADKGPYTLSARNHLRICGFKDARKLYRERKKKTPVYLAN